MIDVLADIERQRVQINILARPQQARFRRDILEASGGKCVVTGVKLRDVLEAAHIKPVSDGGNDHVSNGFCMRADIHALFDTSHLKIHPSGNYSFLMRLDVKLSMPHYLARSSSLHT